MSKDSHLVNVFHGVNITEFLAKSPEYYVIEYLLFWTVFMWHMKDIFRDFVALFMEGFIL